MLSEGIPISENWRKHSCTRTKTQNIFAAVAFLPLIPLIDCSQLQWNTWSVWNKLCWTVWKKKKRSWKTIVPVRTEPHVWIGKVVLGLPNLRGKHTCCLEVLRSEVHNQFQGTKVKVWAGLVPAGGSKENPVPLPFRASRGCLCLLICRPFLHLQTSLQSHLPSSHCLLFWLWLLLS